LKIRPLYYRLFALILTVWAGASGLSHTILAQPESLELAAVHSRIESATPASGFQFAVILDYQGNEPATFTLQADGPEGWTTYITTIYGSTPISAIELQPNKETPDQVKVVAMSPAYNIIQPGEYMITLRCTSGDLDDSIVLTAVVLPTYSMTLTLSPRDYPNEVTAGEDNVLSMRLQNTGGGEINDITFTAQKPEDWAIIFEPAEVTSLDINSYEVINIIIKPPAETDPQDYQITIIAASEQATTQMDIWVRVNPPMTGWLWIGITLISLVIAGFVIVFLRLRKQ